MSVDRISIVSDKKRDHTHPVVVLQSAGSPKIDSENPLIEFALSANMVARLYGAIMSSSST
jgi:hypothetical protein